MDITISKPWATVFLFGNTRGLWVSSENCWMHGKWFENLLDYHEAQRAIIFGILGTSGRNQVICFPSLPQSHTKREGPCDLKIQFANVQSLLVINSPLKMSRAGTFKCKCLTGLQAGKSHISARLQAHSGWHTHHQAALPTSWPASCHHTRTGSTYWGQEDVHFLRIQGTFQKFTGPLQERADGVLWPST